MRVGIGIATYNRLGILEKTILRVQTRTRTAFSLAVADDGSTDATVAWLSENRINHVTGKNQGPCWNRNRLLHRLFVVEKLSRALLMDDDIHPTVDGWEKPWFRAASLNGICMWGYQLPPGTDRPVQTPANGGPLVVTAREAFTALGYFDPLYGDGWGGEDSDYARRAVRFYRWDAMPCINYGVEHVGADASFFEPEGFRRNMELYHADADKRIYRDPWRTEEEKAEFLEECGQWAVWT